MDADEIVVRVIGHSVEKQIEALGFSEFQISGVVETVVHDRVNLTYPQYLGLRAPQTVLELRTFSRVLHPRYFVLDDKVVAQDFRMAESSTAPPMGLLEAKVGDEIKAKAAKLVAAIKILQLRPIDDPYWNSKEFAEVIRYGEMQHEINEYFGNISAPRHKPERVPDPEKLEQTYRRVREFHLIRKKGMSVRNAQHRTHCDPRTYYSFCEAATGEKFIPA